MNIFNLFHKNCLSGLLCVCFGLLSLSAMAQDNDPRTELQGAVSSQDLKKGISGAQIIIYKNGSKSETITTDAKGKFDIFLNPGALYKVEFKFSNHVTKRIEVDTRALTPESEYGGYFKFDMSLFEERDGLDVSILNKPIAKLYYDEGMGEINFDKEYTKSIKSEIERLQTELEEKLAAEAAAKKQMEADYNKAIATADKAMGSKDYLKAKQEYSRALNIKPDEKYPQDKLEEARAAYDKAQADKNKEKEYKEAVESAEYALYEEDLNQAEAEFERALSIKPGDKYAKDQIKEIRDKKMGMARAEQDYLVAIQKADAALAAKDYLTAKGEYQKAATAKPSEVYPKDQLGQVEALIKEDANREKNYIEAIGKGDNAMENKDLEAAKAAFERASEIKPDESYPKTQIQEIDKLLAEQAKLEESYQAALKSGDEALSKEDFEGAKKFFTEALNIKPAQQYPSDKLKEIEAKIAAMAETNAKYDEIIKEADSRFSIKEYVAAKAEYDKALQLKPKEEYPKKQLAIVTKFLEEAAEKEEAYKAAISNGDNAFNAKDYLSAKIEYESALKAKPEDTYATEQLEKAKASIAEAEKSEADYSAAIEKGDAAFDAQDFSNAKTSYEEALALKPDEKYPQKRIAEIEDKLVEIENSNKKYDEAIAKADAAFESKNYEESKASYDAAIEIKPTEQYPKDQLAKISQLMAESEKLDADYQAAIQSGDKAMEASDYPTAKAEFQKALGLKPDEKYPTDKISEIDGLVAEMEKKDQEYLAFVKEGDDAFASSDYDAAKSAYESALGVKPDEEHPKTKLAEIAAKQEASAKAEQDYIAAIEKAEKAEKAKDYTVAKQEFETASSIKPDEQYPKDKIAEITALIADSEKLEADYSEAIKLGDEAFTNKEYDIAKSSYDKALGLKPNESYPKDKLAEIEKIKADEQQAIELANAAQKEYDDLIAKADASFEEEKYEEAKVDYEAALGVKPEEQYPKDQLTKVAEKIAEKEALALAEADKKEKKEAYDQAISAADKAYGAKEYQDAISSYEEAQKILPEETYPADQIALINQTIADEQNAIELANKAKEEEYNAHIAKADQSFEAKEFEAAKESYKAALDVKPEEQYPKDQIDKIASQLANAAETEKKYNDLISAADKSFKSEDYESAKSTYQSALEVKPGEQYPADQLTEIDRLIAEAAALAAQAEQEANAKAIEEKYNDLISAGDQSFKSEDYESAKTNYQSALEVKPGEQYPTDQLTEIDRLIAEAAALAAQAEKDANAKALEEKYDGFISVADKSFKSEDYESARTNYQSALEVKPGEQYPTDQLSEIDRLIAEAAALAAQAEKDANAKAIEEKYKGLISSADKSFKSGDYESAKTDYQAALEVKPTEQYPTDQLAEIDRRVAEAAALAEKERLEADAKNKEKQYKEFIDSGNKSFKSKEYESAKNSYQSALELKPAEAYPAERLKEIEGLLASEINLRKKEVEYESFIAKGDAAFDSKDYSGAISAYQSALDIKPEESYPKDRIAMATEALGELAESERLANEAKQKEQARYNNFISLADNAFNAEKYEEATKSYKLALGLKPGEKYPQDQINEITKLLDEKSRKDKENADRAEMLANYDKEILKGDRAFSAKNYGAANAAYQSALSIMPDERYPKDKLKEIKDLLSQKEEVAVKPEKPRARLTGQSDEDIAARIAEMIRKREQAKLDGVNAIKQDVNDFQSVNTKDSKQRRSDAKADLDLLEETISQQNKEKEELHVAKVEDMEDYKEEIAELNKNLSDEADGRREDSNRDLEELTEEIRARNEKGEALHLINADKVTTVKIELDQTEKDRLASAQDRRDISTNTIAEIEDNLQKIGENGKEIHQRNSENLADFEKGLNENNAELNEQSEERRQENFEQQEELSEEILDWNKEKSKSYLKGTKRVEKDEKTWYKEQEDRSKSADKRRDANQQAIIEYTEEVAEITDSKHNQYEANNEQVMKEQEAVTGYQKDLSDNADQKRDNYNVVYYQGEKKPRLSENASKYPNGVSEETYEEGNAIIVKRFVSDGETLDEYEKIYYTWGGVFYKKNGNDISEEIWETETK